MLTIFYTQHIHTSRHVVFNLCVKFWTKGLHLCFINLLPDCIIVYCFNFHVGRLPRQETDITYILPILVHFKTKRANPQS